MNRERGGAQQAAHNTAPDSPAKEVFTGASFASRSFEAAVFVAAVAALTGIYRLPASFLSAGPRLPVPLNSAAIVIGVLATVLAVAWGGIYRLPIGAKRYVSFGSGAAFAALLIFPPLLALVPAGIGVVIGQLVVRRRRRLTVPTIIFNVTQYLLTWSLVVVLFHRLWIDLPRVAPDLRFWAVILVVTLVYVLVNSWVVATWASLRKRTSAWSVWTTGLRDSFAANASMLLVGAVAARLAIIHPLYVVPLLLSVVLVFWGQSRMGEMQRRQITTTLSSLVEANERLSPFMFEHSERVAWWAERLAREAGLPESEAELLWFAGKLHDLGMMLLRRDLEATPDALTEVQEALLRQHSAIGADAIARLPGMGKVAQYVRGHHENYDGTGYPDGLRGEKIPLGARILRIAGAYDSLRSPRPYRAPYDEDGALARLLAKSGAEYDPVLLRAFARLAKTAEGAPSFAGVLAKIGPQPMLAMAAATASAGGSATWQAWKARVPVMDGQTASEEQRTAVAPAAPAVETESQAAPYLVAIQETERRRIGRELHDEIGQALTGLKLTLEALPGQPEDTWAPKLEDAREVVSDLMARVHDISLQLRPAVLDDLGLLPALQWHVERFQAQTGVRVAFTHAGLNRRFSTGVETAAYRIAQEALTNVARHAKVSDARLRVWSTDHTLFVQVEDHGRGFDPGGVESNGLVGMRERAILVGGRLDVETGASTGTRINAVLPITVEGARRAQ